MKEFKGKAIYQPSGKAAEYSKWAVNFYNGCSAKCEYCYNRHGITAKILGCDIPTLKKSLINVETAHTIFCTEVDKNLLELQQHGLFFNFVSDPCLPETWALNSLCMRYCILWHIPVKILTKQTWWVNHFINEFIQNGTIWNTCNTQKFFAIGFTLTGYNELEPGAASNGDRIEAMKQLHTLGFKTWASIEPIIDVDISMAMISLIKRSVDLVKIGLKSGSKYEGFQLRVMLYTVVALSKQYGFKVYFKDSFLKQAGITRKDILAENCIDRDFNLFHNFKQFPK